MNNKHQFADFTAGGRVTPDDSSCATIDAMDPLTYKIHLLLQSKQKGGVRLKFRSLDPTALSDDDKLKLIADIQQSLGIKPFKGDFL